MIARLALLAPALASLALASLALTPLALSGCYFSRSPMRPMPALYAQAGAQRSPCLVIMMQGILDGPDAFLEHDAVRDLRAVSQCDAVMVDANFRYYFGARIADALYEDVLHPALARGYEEIWLVGVSLGGLGAVLLAREHPEDITGIVLLSPFLGVDPVISEQASAIGTRHTYRAAWKTRSSPPPCGRGCAATSPTPTRCPRCTWAGPRASCASRWRAPSPTCSRPPTSPTWPAATTGPPGRSSSARS